MVAHPNDLDPLAHGVPPRLTHTTANGVVRGIRCPFCEGNVYASDGELACMMCARTLLLMPSVTGSVEIGTGWRAPVTRRVGDGEAQRTARGISEAQGSTGLAARILAAIPEAPEHVTAWALGRPIRIPTEEVRAVLLELIDLGLVVEVLYQAGCVEKRTSRGYQRPRLEDDHATAV